MEITSLHLEECRLAWAIWTANALLTSLEALDPQMPLWSNTCLKLRSMIRR